MFGGLFRQDFLDGFLGVSLGANVLSPEFEVGVDTIHVVIQDKGVGRFLGGGALVDGVFMMPARRSVGAMFHEVETVGGAVATIGRGFNGTIIIGMRLVKTNLILGAEGAARARHFRHRGLGGNTKKWDAWGEPIF
jgi:hypothetical protein